MHIEEHAGLKDDPALPHNLHVKAVYEHLSARGKSEMPALCTIVLLHFGAKKHKPYQHKYAKIAWPGKRYLR